MNIFDNGAAKVDNTTMITPENEKVETTEKETETMMNPIEELNAPEMQDFAKDMIDIRNQAGEYLTEANEAIDTHEAYARQGRNHEYYRDPTYTAVRRNEDRPRYRVAPPANGYSQPRTYYEKLPYNNGIPVYTGRKSRQYETVGVIIRLLDLAGFELAERLVLRDKETGEVLR